MCEVVVFQSRITLKRKIMLTLEYVVMCVPTSVADECPLALLCQCLLHGRMRDSGEQNSDAYENMS